MVCFLDRNGKEYKVGQDPDVNDIKYFKIATKVTNFGKLPAERIEFTATSTPSVFSFRNTKKNIIYDELKSESQIFSTEKLGDIFKNKSEFTIKLELKYHLLGSSKIYIAFSESKCIARLLGTAIQISCGLMQEGTD